MNYLVIESNELYHHGILGQKWGVRRYQNPDGTLTKAGKKRYGTVANFNKVKRAKDKSDEYKKNAKYAKNVEKDIYRLTGSKPIKEKKELSNAEISDKITRLTLEAELERAQQRLNSLRPAEKTKVDKFISGVKKINEVYNGIPEPLQKVLSEKVKDVFGVNEKKEDASRKLQKEAEDWVNRQKIAEAKDKINNIRKREQRKKETGLVDGK